MKYTIFIYFSSFPTQLLITYCPQERKIINDLITKFVYETLG